MYEGKTSEPAMRRGAKNTGQARTGNNRENARIEDRSAGIAASAANLAAPATIRCKIENL